MESQPRGEIQITTGGKEASASAPANYDQTGAVRDIIQTTCSAPGPRTMSRHHLRRRVRCAAPKRAAFARCAGSVRLCGPRAYTGTSDEEAVANDSRRETYAAARLSTRTGAGMASRSFFAPARSST